MTASVPIRASVIQALLDIAGGSIYDNALPESFMGGRSQAPWRLD